MNVTAAVACAILLVPSWARAQTLGSARVDGDGIRLEFDGRMKSRVVATFAGETPLGPFEDSETLLTAAGDDLAPLVCPALGAGAMGQLRLSALGAGRSQNGRQKVMGAPFVPPCPGMSFYGVWHR